MKSHQNTHFLDVILECREGYLLAQKTFPRDDEIFLDHFPGCPVVPGSLLIESMSQAAALLAAYTEDFSLLPVLLKIEAAKFRRFATPDELLDIEVKVQTSGPTECALIGQISGSQSRTAGAQFQFKLLPISSGPARTWRHSFASLLREYP